MAWASFFSDFVFFMAKFVLLSVVKTDAVWYRKSLHTHDINVNVVKSADKIERLIKTDTYMTLM